MYALQKAGANYTGWSSPHLRHDERDGTNIGAFASRARVLDGAHEARAKHGDDGVRGVARDGEGQPVRALQLRR